ncbi:MULTISPECIES: Na+/H+ antiporter NhaC family protein [unclassified Fusibacter]|uniref:Na+/H+ antiporter NhaC family protein n=1 Tax=unclassified Fusibacter TaxID=2624464 RepID=UPI0010105265|nr:MULTISPECIES: Na+/H+ antiporter NhaC family protein [unclassified Fusibacter]MCK8061310.1 hypothetical protein [Fusibacter sp. A2]NPE23493.1 hypothetical protein [Fusibacter sp. A1]RXV59099.1 hypothetical protein DWB64_16880 [Fusibacter sp. A1]
MNSIKFYEATLLVAFLVLSLAICLLLSLPMYVGLLAALTVTGTVYIIKGAALKSMLPSMAYGIRRILPVIVILGSIGGLIAVWMSSGVLATLLNYCFVFLTSINLVLAAFLLSLVISMILGTAIGTIGTIGTLMLALGATLHVPAELMVGAIVSGAYFGDRTSPLSSSANLTATVVGTEIDNHIKGLLKTSYLPLLISAVLYYILGSPYIADASTYMSIAENKELLSSLFEMTPYKLLPVIVLVLSVVIFKQGILKSVCYSLVSALLIGFGEGIPLTYLLKTAVVGFHPESNELTELFSGAGVISMVGIFIVISSAATLNALYEYGNLLDPIFQRLDKWTTNYTKLMLSSGLVSFIIMVMTCNQSLPAIITGRHYTQLFKQKNIDVSYLSRTISDFAIILVPIIPWNINALLVKSVTNVPATAYYKYAFTTVAIPILSILIILLEHKKNNRN